MYSYSSRRDFFGTVPLTIGAGLAALGMAPTPGRANAPRPADPASTSFRYSLNTSTIRGQKVPLAEEVDIAAEAGYHAIEPWIREIDEYVAGGGSLPDLARRISDRGLTVESAIGFFDWAVDDPDRRKKGLEEGRRSLDLVRQLGGKRLAAPPTGVTDQAGISLDILSDRFRDVLNMADDTGVVPQLEVWGFSKTVSRVSEAAYIALATGHPKACILADVYHLYKGGSPFQTISLLSGLAMQVFHLNDYPDIPPSEIKDENRVYPGDGIAPLAEVFQALRASGFNGTLSLELFNRDYWQQDPRLVARTGLAKLKAAVEASTQ